MTGIGPCFCGQISQISESDQSLCVVFFFSYTNNLAVVSRRVHCFGL